MLLVVKVKLIRISDERFFSTWIAAKKSQLGSLKFSAKLVFQC